MSDYRIKITIRNDRMLSAMEEMGYVSVASFCKKFNRPYGITAEYFAGKRSALNMHGELKDDVKELLLLLDLTPEQVNKVPTFEEIGLVFKVSNTRAQQIYLNGIHKLRTRDNIELINKSTESSFNFNTMKELKDLRIVK